MKTILQTKGLCKENGGTKILKGIDIQVEEGEFVAVMGQSGSGKTTLLYSISGIDRENEGEIYFEGEDITKLDNEKMVSVRLNKMGFIFQQTHLYKSLSIRDNIVSPALKAGVSNNNEINEYAVQLMKRYGIFSIANDDTKKVNGAQLQRAAICRALINHPNIIFADEPTGELKSIDAKEIMDIFNELNLEGTSIIVVTRDSKTAVRADKVVFLADGVITGQIVLGRYSEKNLADRQKKLSAWIEKQIS